MKAKNIILGGLALAVVGGGVYFYFKKKKTPNALSKDVIEKRKIKRKLTLNDTDYAREAERREKRASLVASLRKKETEKIKDKSIIENVLSRSDSYWSPIIRIHPDIRPSRWIKYSYYK